MKSNVSLAREIQKAVHTKAYAYGIPESICTLLSEYVHELLTTLYAERSKKLVSTTI